MFAGAFSEFDGEAARLLRSRDWAKTALGPVEGWSQSLKTIVGVMLGSRHPMFLFWGPELTQIYNDAYTPSFGEGKHPMAMGQAGRDCWQEIWPIIWPQIDDVMARGKASWNEDQLVPIFRNGRIEEVYWTYGYSPVPDDDGSIGGTLVVCTETTARVISERRLQFLHRLTERMVAATTLAEVQSVLMATCSDAADDIPFVLVYQSVLSGGARGLVGSMGIAAESLPAVDAFIGSLGLTFTGESREREGCVVALPPEVQKICPEAFSEVFVAPLPSAGTTGGFMVFGVSPRLPFDDRYRGFLAQAVQVFNSAHSRVERFRIRAALEGERNNLLLQAPIATALLMGPAHIFQLANQRFREIVGINRTLDGKSYAEAFPELVESEITGILDRVYRSGEPFVANEMFVPLVRDEDGAVEGGYYHFNLEPIRDLSGVVCGMMAVASDVTQQVTSRISLERASSERERLLGDLRAASRAKDEFLAMLGHELRNPLSPIVTALELMKQRGGGETRRELTVIERQVTHLVRLVDDLLDISKITRGKVELRREIVDLAEVMTKAVEIASHLLEQRSHQLTLEVPSGLRWEGDPVRLAQVVANLLTNAARYTTEGGRIDLRVATDGPGVLISVSDNGAGIASDVLPHIFDLFFQGARSNDRAQGGLGLGLTLVKSLVTMHGGTVTATSAGLGRGSEFTIRLPRTTETRTAPRAADTSTPPLALQLAKRILVVDDNEDAADMLCEMLRSVGHEVAVANDPLVALATAERFKPQIAVVDIGLPVMDGYELAAKLRECLTSKQFRLVALTGYGQENDLAQSKAAGFDVHLVKPVNIERLLSIVAEPVAAV